MSEMKKPFQFEVAKADKGYRMFDYKTQQPYYIPYDELKRDKKLLAKILKKEMHRFTKLWNDSLLSEEILQNLANAAEQAGVPIIPINDLIKNTITIKEGENDSKDN